MQGLDENTKSVISDLARRYSLSDEAVLAMLAAIERGQGTMAQFNIPELGGNGQWMMGGMTMVGDMFNYGLKSTVDGLCGALSQALGNGSIQMPRAVTGGQTWWPADLGAPSSVGGQNDSAYAVFPAARRLAIRDGSGVRLYDTGDHLISGVGQQQGSNSSLTFSSQLGSFSVSGLRQVEGNTSATAHSSDSGSRSETDGNGQWRGQEQAQSHGNWQQHQDNRPQGQSQRQAGFGSPSEPASQAGAGLAEQHRETRDPLPAPAFSPPTASQPPVDGLQLVALIEKLGALRDAGLLTEGEFSAKKADLLSRL